MKANRKFIDNDEAVSPVIAVILMVAITVVLAATVFVLVNDLGKNVGSTGPSLGLVSDASGSSTSKWTVKISSATKLADLNDYKFVLSTPSHGTIVATTAASSGQFTDGYQQNVSAPASDTSRKETADTAFADPGYQFTWTDIDGNGKLSVGDTIVIQYDGSDDGDDDPGSSAFAAGEYSMEILHTPSGSSAASLPRTF